MRKNSLLYGALILSIVFAGLNLLALEFHFYWVYWWFDVLMHFMAGLVGGLATYWVLFNSGHFWGNNAPIFFRFATVFVCVMIAGFLWEWLELIFGLTGSHEGYPVDPLFDLFLDGAGAVLAVLIGLKKHHG